MAIERHGASEQTNRLPPDGETIRCSYAVVNRVTDWRCSETAVEALTEPLYRRYLEHKAGDVYVHGRAFCPSHLELILGLVGRKR